MDCLRCGTDIGSALGLCSACSTARNSLAEIELEQISPKRISSNAVSSFLWDPRILAVSVLVPIAMLVVWYSTLDDHIEISSSASTLIMSSKDQSYRVEYQITGRSTFQGRVLNFDLNRLSFQSGGFRAVLSYLSESEYQEMLSIRGCKAGFLNAHAKHLLLVPLSNTVAEEYAHKDLQRGSKFSLKGLNLKPKKVVFESNKLPESQWFPGHNIIALEKMNF
jgi:hypothetical protein